MKTALFIYTETPLHAGTGTGLGAVDLPIQREKHTDYPIIQASGVKGAVRDTFEFVTRTPIYQQARDEGWTDGELKAALKQTDDEIIIPIFGGASGAPGDDFAGAVSPSDARILLFPVRALKGVFVWVTSPMVLSRFAQDARNAADVPGIPDVPADSALASAETMRTNQQIMLEEYAYPATIDPIAQQWAAYLAQHALPPAGYDFWRTRLQNHLAILPDDDFRDFVKYGTDIVTRIHLDDVKKTVQAGQLFTQELLPADSLLYSVVNVTNTRNNGQYIAAQVQQSLKDTIGSSIQIGADETVGRGRVRLNWMEVEA